jgi:hypothetical protein
VRRRSSDSQGWVGQVTASQSEVPFSLTCVDCDLGDGIDTREQATLAGWHEIRREDGGSYNYLGWCPECWEEVSLSPGYKGKAR